MRLVRHMVPTLLLVLALGAFELIRAQDTRPRTLACGGSFDVTPPSSTKIYTRPLLTYNFGRTFAFYQEGTSILAKLRSSDNGTFLQEPEVAVATGALLAANQDPNVGLAIYREQDTQDVVARTVDVLTRAVSNRINVLRQFECDSDTVGTAFSNNIGFIVWGSSIEGNNATLLRQSPIFSTVPAFDRLLVNQTKGGYIEAAAMDSTGTVLFIFNNGEDRSCGYLGTGTSLSFIVRNRITEVGVVPLPLSVQKPALFSNRQNEFILMGSSVRGSDRVIHALHTFNVGGSWTEILDVLVVPNNPLAQPPFAVTWTDRWVVAYDSADVGYQVLQMEKPYPFLFDWREAQRNAFKANVSSPSLPLMRSVALLPRFSTLLMLTSANTPEGGAKIVAIGCSLRIANGAVVGQDKPRLTLLLCALLSLLALTW